MSKECAIEGCNEHVRSTGLCAKHYRRKWLYGDPTYEKQDYDRPKSCSACGINKVKALGLCPNCYAKNRRKEMGCNQYMIGGKSNNDCECIEEGCSKPALARKLCRRHYLKKRAEEDEHKLEASK
ncbi:putative endonuclease [Paenibacillus sp. TCA20]|uniref:HNH endonuclease n=1 Tax=Paenibacillus urinalis TaxID=521520 RepID=A0ABY7XH98_9BACL|nr:MULTISPECIES: hypothetical protein [Paenibacillus]WDI05162.1 hypothetical protein PUW25_25475 [Paenibacillus urinalis]GAK42012.1 putative endonuclease [Paenibacillus sp. TCA20]